MVAITKRAVAVKLGQMIGTPVRKSNIAISIIADAIRDDIIEGSFHFPGFLILEKVYLPLGDRKFYEDEWGVNATFYTEEDELPTSDEFLFRMALLGIKSNYVRAYFKILKEIYLSGESFTIANVGIFRIDPYNRPPRKVGFKPYHKLCVAILEHANTTDLHETEK